MKLFRSPDFRLFLFFSILIVFVCAPIWTFEYFFNLDGSAHLYSAHLMLELIKGNPTFTEIYTFNSISIPNVSGHWLLALLLNLFPPGAVTRIIVTLTFAGFVASIGWLRFRTAGREGLKTSLLLGAAIGLNWFWFMGFYNFIIGVTVLIFTLGLFYGWREEMNWRRSVMLSFLLLLVYFSHLISFAILAGSLFVLVLFGKRSGLKKGLLWTFLAILPVLPFVYLYKSLSSVGGEFSPVWLGLENPYSILDWLSRLTTANSFFIIGERAFPFSNYYSDYFKAFKPAFWLLAAFLLLTFTAVYSLGKELFVSRKYLPFLLLLFVSLLTVMFAPDHFGFSHGTILRERILFCGLIFFVPIFSTVKAIWAKRLAQFCLLFIIFFQTAALWDYSFETNREAKEFLSAGQAIEENGGALASIILMDADPKFYSRPVAQMSTYLGLEKNIVAWDNYEIGVHIFPIIAKNPDDRQFVLDFTTANSFFPNPTEENFKDQLSKFESCLKNNHHKIETMIVRGKHEKVEAVLYKWFEPEPFFENGRVRLFRHK